MSYALVVNGAEHRLDTPSDESLSSLLRNNLELTGTKYGCGEGHCGACAGLLDDKPVRSCRTPVSLAVGKRIRTIEGLEQNGRLHPVQEAFLSVEAFQCAYCNSGMIMSAGAGETPMMGIAPAISNAIFSATGTRLRSLPRTLHQELKQ